MTLEELNRIVASRAEADPEDSWTAKLLAKGPAKCAEKFGEEAIEAIIEAARGEPQKLAAETADVLFHLLVMLKACDVPLADVMAVLDSRTGRSGITEKAQRTRQG